jgi:hypothetical protein
MAERLVGREHDGDLGIKGRIITNKLHGVEPFLRRRQSLSYSRILWNPKIH